MILPAFSALLAESIPKTGSAFIPSLLLKEGFAPTSTVTASDDAPADAGEFLKMQANGKHDAAETPAPYVGFTTGYDDPQRYRDMFHELYEGGNLPHENAQAADRYEILAQSAVPSFLVCATTVKADGTISDPFLAVVAFPTAFRKGNTHAAKNLERNETRHAYARRHHWSRTDRLRGDGFDGAELEGLGDDAEQRPLPRELHPEKHGDLLF